MDLDWLISVDDHILEPPDLWEKRLPKKFVDQGPRLVRDGDEEYWVAEGRRVPTIGLTAVAGKSEREFSPLPVRYDEMRPGCYEPVARLRDMNEAGILASLCFPSYPRFCGQVFSEMDDRELGLACLKAYNDFMIDEWCGSAPGRFIALTVIPFWDTALAVKEIERCAEAGTRAVAFSENPYHLGYPSLYDASCYWDPVFACAEEIGLPLCMHLGSSSTTNPPSPDAPFIATHTFGISKPIATLINWIFSGTLDRFPNLKICLSEGGIGWIAPVLERAELVWEKQRHWATRIDLNTSGKQQDVVPIQDATGMSLDFSGRKPTEQFLSQVYGCFIEDFYGVQAMKDLGGLDNIMIETDYPHSDSSWPNSIKLAHQQVASLSDAEKYAVLRGNAERVFNFKPAEPPSFVA